MIDQPWRGRAGQLGGIFVTNWTHGATTTSRRQLLLAVLLSTTALVGGLSATESHAQVVIDGPPGTQQSVPGSQTSPWAIPGNGGLGSLTVGSSQNGRLEIGTGGRVESNSGTVGDNAGSIGEVDVTGAGAIWDNQSSLRVGVDGTGTLRLENGGTVTTDGTVFLGVGSQGSGTVIVTGTGSTLQANSNVQIGDSGTGNLQVRNGGAFTTTGASIIGARTGAEGTVTVTGVGSSWATGRFALGQDGTGRLIVSDGATVDTTDAIWGVIIGSQTGSSGEALITGAGSRWTNTGPMRVGSLGRGSLRVENGASVETDSFVSIGAGADAEGSVTVSGAGSIWSAASSFSIGQMGTGDLTVSDDGQVEVVSGTGTITIAQQAGSTGVLNIGAPAGQTAAGAGSVKAQTINFGAGDSRLVFNHTDESYVFSADISNDGVVEHYAGTTIFTGALQHTGGTLLKGGTMLINGEIAGTVDVSGGVLGGSGSFSNLTVENGGIVSPGNSIGTLTVAGDVAFNAGSTLQVEVAPDGTSDLLAVGGAATIATTGTTLDVLGLPGDFPQASPTYVVLRADGGVTGQFATVRDNLPDLDFTQTVAATEVQLSYVQTQTPGGGGNGGTGGDNGGLSPKEIHPSALGAGMQGAVLFGETLRRRGGLVANQLSGSSQGATARSALLGFVERPAPESRALPAHALAADMPSLPSEAFAAPRDRWAVWGAVLGQDLSVDADGATPGWDAQTGGLAFGFERHFEGLAFPTLAGLAFGYARSSVDSGASDADIDAFHIGAYAATRAGALTLSGALAYAWQDYAFERVIPVAGTRVIAEGDTDGQTFVASAEAFYDMSHHLGAGWPGQGLRFGPLATIDAVHGEQDGFTETGAGILDLTVSGTSADQVVTGLGIGFGVDRAMGATLVSLDGRVAWEHVFGDRSISTVSAIPVANAVFTSGSAPVSRDRLAVGVGAAIAFTDTISTELRYDGAFADTGNDHQGTASLTIRF